MDPSTPVELRTDRATRAVYATDNSIYQVTPAAVAVPEDAAMLAEIVSRNRQRRNPWPVVARGGGTGTNGQSLTDGLVIDVKRKMNSIVSIDAASMTAWVEPGVVTDELNRALEPHGLFWAPHTSTTSRATVGGMIATDAAGKGSLVHGRAHNHVLALDVVLADGSMFRAEPLPVREAQARASESTTSGRIWRMLLELAEEGMAKVVVPELARGFSGYGIDRLRRGEVIDPVPLLVGSEGTLAITTAAQLRLTPIATHTVLVVASYASFNDALRDAVGLRDTNPTAIETFDERTLRAGRGSPAWSALGSVVGENDGAVLLLEYSGQEPVDDAALLEDVHRSGRCRSAHAVHDATDRAEVWRVRADAVGLLAKLVVGDGVRAARPTAFVEDCAVPVASMCEFISEFRAVLERHGVDYAMFGHADVGCVHVRPALDLTDPAHERLVRTITDEVVEAVSRYGGVLWGEHGRGFRGASADSFLSPGTIHMMRRVKTAFDPDDLFNPGKLYRPLGSADPIVDVDAPAMRGQHDRQIPVAERRDFASAFACNGNGVCHHHDSTELMCPSYKVGGDPALSPKGRADLLREWLRLRATEQPDHDFEDALADNLAKCLSCSACSGSCPVEVDIPELKSRFLEEHYSSRRRPLSHHVLGRFESLATLAARAPRLSVLGRRPVGRLLGMVDLPLPHPRVPHGTERWTDDGAAVDLVVLQDVFTSTLESETLAATTRVLSDLGWTVAVAPFVPSGKFDHVVGNRTRFARSARAQGALIQRVVASGARPVSIEPATTLLQRHEYPVMEGEHPGDLVWPLSEVLLERVDRLAPRPAESVRLFGHCTERTLAPEWVSQWARLLESAGHEVEVASTGCCGMAGIYGHQQENQVASRALWDLTWAKPTRTHKRLVATGFSCRSQAKRMAAHQMVHPIHLL